MKKLALLVCLIALSVGAVDTIQISGVGNFTGTITLTLSIGSPQVVPTTWITGSQPVDLTCREVVWADSLGLFVAVSDTLGKAMTSADGITYNIQTCGPNEWEALCWSPQLGKLVSLGIDGTGNRVMTSANGTNWANGSTIADATWLSVCWAPELSLFCGVGYGPGAYVTTSPNGTNWISRTVNSANFWEGVAWSPTLHLFVAVSSNLNQTNVMTSPDGITWTSRTTPVPSYSWNDVCWSTELGMFVAVAGYGPAPGGRVMTSKNGINWAYQNASEANEWMSVKWSPQLGLFVAVAQNGLNQIMTSVDGTNWLAQAAPAPDGLQRRWACVAYSPQLIRFSAVADIVGIEDTTKRVMAGYVTTTNVTSVLAHRYGSVGSDTGSTIIMDGTNLLMAGTFSANMSIGSQALTNAGGRDVFIALFDTNSTALWAKRFGSTGDEYITGVAVDDSGNIYTCGYFGGQGNLGGTTTTSSGGWDFYIAKYDSTGNFLWNRKVGGTADDVATCLTLDLYKTNVLVGGHYQGTCNFGNTNHSSFDTGTDSFVGKYSTASGAPVWAQTWLNRGYDTPIGIKIDATGNMYLVGYIGTRINFGNGLLTTVGGTGLNDIYLVKWSTPGATPPITPTWSKLAGSTNGESSYAFNLDSDGNVVVGGTFTTYTDLGGGVIMGTGSDTDMFLAKYSGVDGSYLWARGLLCTQGGAPRGIAFDSSKNPVMCGYFYGTCNFGGGPPLVSSAGSFDVFLAKYSSAAGAYSWAERAGGTSGDDCGGLVLDNYNYPNVTGSFSATAGFGTTSLISAGLGDIFLWRHLP